jgi:hypothetical protein
MSIRHRTWTAASARWFGLITTTVLALGRESQVELRLEAPLDYQVVQRSSRETGTLVLEGTTSTGAAMAGIQLEVRVVRSTTGEPLTSNWIPTATDPRVPRFRSEIKIPAGGWYRVEARLRLGASTIATSQVAHVGVGEVFLVAGQSNSANHGEERTTPASDQVVHFDGTRWKVAADPQPGASGDGGSFLPTFGDAMARQFHVPVGFVATGAGGTSVREWLPRGEEMAAPPTTGANTVTVGPNQWASTGELYQRLIERGRGLGEGRFRAVLWHQGESDNHQPEGRNISPQQYQEYLRRVIRGSRTDWGWNVPWFVALASYHTPEQTGSPELRAAQMGLTRNGFALAGPDTDALDGPFRESQGRGVHFNRRGLVRHGELWEEKVGPWLERQLQ